MLIGFLKKYYFILLAVLIAVAGYFFIRTVGREYVYVDKQFNSSMNVTDVTIAKDSTGMAEVLNWNTTDKKLFVRLRSVSEGKVFLSIIHNGEEGVGVLYVHKDGVITSERFFGDCTGFTAINVCIILYVFLLIAHLMRIYRQKVNNNLYSYDNVLYLGLIIFSLFVAYTQVKSIIFKNGLIGSFYQAVSSSQTFILITFPVVIITTICVTVSNVQLMRKEGVSWRNLLAVFLGLFLGFGSVLFFFAGVFLQTTTLIDVHFERGVGRFVEIFIENGLSSIVTYFECILLGTIIISIKAARNIPAFDKDYIIIHGCQIRKDGSLTPLLKSRADRAIEFAKMQKEKTGKKVVFVPSGGKGSDEVISEAEAIKRYLLEQGISEEQILAEPHSQSTEENIRFSKNKMCEHFGSDGYKVAFSTTNYHVFRTSMLAIQNGLNAEGIGAKTKSYFWINAFVREFIATVVTEKLTHLKVILILILINIISVLLMYVSEVVLF